MKLIEQPGFMVKQEDWNNLAAMLVRIGYGVMIGKEKNPETGKARRTIQLLEPKEFVRRAP